VRQVSCHGVGVGVGRAIAAGLRVVERSRVRQTVFAGQALDEPALRRAASGLAISEQGRAEAKWKNWVDDFSVPITSASAA
jgi:hypothetical protein